MRKKLRSLMSYTAGCCIGLLAIALITRKYDTIMITALLVLLTVIIFSIRLLVESEKENDELQKQIKQIREHNRHCNQLCWDLEQWQSQARTVVEDIDEKIAEYLDKQNATEFDEKYSTLARIVIEFNDFDEYYEAFRTYNMLSVRAKNLITINVDQILENYQKALHIWVEVASTKLNHMIPNYKPIADDYDNWQKVVDYYESLPEPVQEVLEMNESSLIKSLYDGFTASKDDLTHEESGL